MPRFSTGASAILKNILDADECTQKLISFLNYIKTERYLGRFCFLQKCLLL